MRRFFSHLKRKEGMTAVETLLALPMVLLMMLLIIQVSVIFINGVMVNHALSAAANEAAARGGVDSQVTAVFRDALPAGIKQQCINRGDNCLTVKQVGSTGALTPVSSAGFISPGNEATNSGAIISIAFKYDQAAPFLGGFSGSALHLTREMRIGSQSLQENR
jgi:Flp pilus assembly protein TadG